jgi:hypothetical protein
MVVLALSSRRGAPRSTVASTGAPLPEARGAVSEALIAVLRGEVAAPVTWPEAIDDPLTGDDSHLALYVLYELHYRSFAGVDDEWEWDRSLLDLRSRLEQRFIDALRAEAGVMSWATELTVAEQLNGLIGAGGGPSLSRFMDEDGSLEHFREFAMHRSAYQLKEADPHTWALPRLAGRSKSAMVTIQTDEYGLGRPGRSHAELFAVTMDALGLDTSYGAYLDVLPGVTLATCNLVSMFGLHRRWRGALVGHLAVFEMTSVVPMSRYASALRRLGSGEPAEEFYRVHVEADVEHAQIAATDLAAGLLHDEPQLGPDLLFGAVALMNCERRLATRLLDCWAAGDSSLLAPPALHRRSRTSAS